MALVMYMRIARLKESFASLNLNILHVPKCSKVVDSPRDFEADNICGRRQYSWSNILRRFDTHFHSGLPEESPPFHSRPAENLTRECCKESSMNPEVWLVGAWGTRQANVTIDVTVSTSLH